MAGEVEFATREEIAAWRSELGEIMQRLNTALAYLPTLPTDATRALEARYAARARGFFWVQEFAAVVGRNAHWVSDRCSAGVIRTLNGGKPYRIPLTEEARWNKDPEAN